MKPSQFKLNEITSEFESIVPDIKEAEYSLKRKFPGYTITYSKFTDIWKVKNKSFTHSIWYNNTKPSKVISIRSKSDLQVSLLNIILIIAAFMLILLSNKYDWGIDGQTILMGWLAIIGSNHYLLRKIKPRYQDDFNDEHIKVLGTLQNLYLETGGGD